jgi:hypothetical protein
LRQAASAMGVPAFHVQGLDCPSIPAEKRQTGVAGGLPTAPSAVPAPP